MSGHMTARNTMSADAASCTVLADASGPRRETTGSRLEGPRRLDSTTSCPALTRWLAMAWPIAPAPIVPYRIGASWCSGILCDQQPDELLPQPQPDWHASS